MHISPFLLRHPCGQGGHDQRLSMFEAGQCWSVVYGILRSCICSRPDLTAPLDWLRERSSPLAPSLVLVFLVVGDAVGLPASLRDISSDLTTPETWKEVEQTGWQCIAYDPARN